MPSGRKKTPAKGKKRSNSPTSSGPGSRFTPGTWIGLLVFASVWMFVLGLLVGRSTAPLGLDVKALENKLAALIDSAEEKQEVQSAIIIADLKHDHKSEGYAKLGADADDAATLEQLPPPREKAGTHSEAKGVKKAPREQKPARAGPKPSAPASPPRQETADSQPPQMPRAALGNGMTFTVHLYSMKDADNAAQKVVQLKRQGLPAHMARVNIPGQGVYYRVMIGRYKKRDDAEKMMKRLKTRQMVGNVISR